LSKNAKDLFEQGKKVKELEDSLENIKNLLRDKDKKFKVYFLVIIRNLKKPTKV